MATSKDAVLSRSRSLAASHADSAWERAQEKGMLALRQGRLDEAKLNWAKALNIAEHNFDRGDPRLATSFTCKGFVLLRQDHVHQANTYFQSAISAWEDAWRWIPMMAPSNTADNDEQPAAYDQVTQDAFYALIEQGKSITEAIQQKQRLPEATGDDWSAVKPKGMNDIRRLFAAVFLMPTAQSSTAGSKTGLRVDQGHH